VSDIDIAVADSLKVLDLKRPIREADIAQDREGPPLDPQRTFDLAAVPLETLVYPSNRA
jgi:hypothetical protein